MPHLSPGQLFGPYRLVAPLSQGGMGEVWRALKLSSGQSGWSRQVALKVILPGYAELETFARLFTAEARIAAGLVHANIVPVSDFGREGGVLFLEQELVDGIDLARLLERCPRGLPIELAIFVLAEALKGLGYAHHHVLPDGRVQNVVHRDVKPANVLVAREGHVKLTDFGVAKVTSASAPSVADLRGTIGYLAPELFEGKPPTPRSDLFAMGLIFWELLTGNRLFGGDSDAVKLFNTYECRVPPLAERGVSVPPAVEGVLRRLLARDPLERFASAEETLEALLAIPGARSATSLELRAFLAAVGVTSLPSIDTSPSLLKRTGTVVGEVNGGTRVGRGLRTTAIMAVLALAGVVAGLGVGLHHDEPSRDAAGVAVVPDAGVRRPEPVDAAPPPPRVIDAAPPPAVVDAAPVDAPPAPPPVLKRRAPARSPAKATRRNDGLFLPDEEP